MNILLVEKADFSNTFPGLNEVSAHLDQKARKNQIIESWESNGYRPEVCFSMAYTDNEILLEYFVTEEYFKAEKTETNQEVYEDSCVEFFVMPDEEDGIYYNLEFNAIGTCLMGSGSSRENRLRSDPGLISGIRRSGSAGEETLKESAGKYSWTMTIAIPLSIFFHHDIKSLEGKSFRANFYKCGNKLTVPHFVAWNKIITDKPDFHQPRFFGLLRFV